jgi:transcriptional regulator
LGRMSDKMLQVLDQVTTPFEILQRRTEDLDHFVGEMIRVGKDQASKVDTVMSNTASRFEQTSDVIQNNLVESALELSAFLRAVKVGLDQLRSGKPSRAA